MNLLTDPLIPVFTAEGRGFLSLPALLAGLGDDRVHRINGLQRHQEDAFHVFLCYLAGAILAREGDWNPHRGEDFWREGMRALAGEAGDDAWTLVVQDLSRAAFMQPPLPESDHGRLKPKAETPDALDLLPTAKNHDVKQARATHSQPHEWLYALISLQTMSGYFGRGKPGISRMNSGFGNRAIVEMTRQRSPAPRWRDAVERLKDHRKQVLAGSLPYRSDGLVLVWVVLWDGKTSLDLAVLDPFYLESCRRVRLTIEGKQAIRGLEIPSQGSRIEAKELKGLMGDAWLPIDLRDPQGAKALTVSPQGWTVDLLRQLLFEDGLQCTVLQKPSDDWQGDAWLLASVLIRGQGTTDGFREYRLPIPSHIKTRMFGPRRDETLAGLAKDAIEFGSQMRNRVLKPAVFMLLEGAPEQLQFDRDSAEAWWGHLAAGFDRRWSDEYFPWLWSQPDPFDKNEARLEWIKRLRAHAEAVLHQAEETLPHHSGHLWRSRIAAARVFDGALHKQFPDLEEASNEHLA